VKSGEGIAFVNEVPVEDPTIAKLIVMELFKKVSYPPIFIT
jgi:hypothetical protein